ncbi:thiol peroxidase [Helicobacter cholecystus]|uniref:Thiol peroxidase n=1 Tax=Helicobacter cholecystus TaxID=45498 RepID=A0A3D8IXG9_9HELI|nr:thiol peroxidase [Helicobacter cholecystus]RDU69680.1 thiol peroxidase [Helicobacter cholecystus]VEJ24244.1 thiol peroxidase [Helicobacter cholecystus]
MKPTFQGNPVSLVGNILNIGENAPEVTLPGKDLNEVKVGGVSEKYQIINVVPSLDTGVCAMQTKKFNTEASKLPNAEVFVISMDLPFAQGRFCSTEGIENLTVLSDFRNKEFGEKYGLLINDTALKGLLTRAVIVIDPEGKIIYQEVVPEITTEPNYQAVLNLF